MEDISHQSSKQSKYSEGNPIARAMVNNFFSKLQSLLLLCSNKDSPNTSGLEVGCGEGELLSRMNTIPGVSQYIGCDIDENRLKEAQSLLGQRFFYGSAYSLPFDDNVFDTVLCCEVLEHLENPVDALGEISRVANGSIIFSVPNEPLWRVLNMMRCKYVSKFGNTPGHVNHWSKKSLVSLLHEFFDIEEVLTPIPWIMVLARKRK